MLKKKMYSFFPLSFWGVIGRVPVHGWLDHGQFAPGHSGAQWQRKITGTTWETMGVYKSTNKYKYTINVYIIYCIWYIFIHIYYTHMWYSADWILPANIGKHVDFYQCGLQPVNVRKDMRWWLPLANGYYPLSNMEIWKRWMEKQWSTILIGFPETL